MIDLVTNIWFFVILIPGTYIVYNLLKIFDYSKIMLRDKVPYLKVLLWIVAFSIAFIFATGVITIIERIANIVS